LELTARADQMFTGGHSLYEAKSKPVLQREQSRAWLAAADHVLADLSWDNTW